MQIHCARKVQSSPRTGRSVTPTVTAGRVFTGKVMVNYNEVKEDNHLINAEEATEKGKIKSIWSLIIPNLGHY